VPQLYWESTDLGDPVAPLTKPAMTRVQIAKFAGASQDWSPLHLDDDFAKTAGYGGVFAHGAISLGFAVEAVNKWLENGRVLQATATFQKLVWPADILTAKGVVVNRSEKDGECRLDVDVWAENQNHDIVMKGQITCLLWRNEKEEKKSKGFPPVSAETIRDRRTAKPIPKTEAEQARAREAALQAQAQAQAAQAPKRLPPTPSKPLLRPTTPMVAPKPLPPKPELKKPEAKKPELKKPEPKKPELKKPDAKKPEAKKPAPKKAELKKPASKKPEAKKPAKPAPKAKAKPAKGKKK
jgi:acyl dehydratase